MSCLRCIVVSLAGGLLLGVTACTPVVVSQRVNLHNGITSDKHHSALLPQDHREVLYCLPKNLVKLSVDIGGFEKPAPNNGGGNGQDKQKETPTATATATASPTVNPVFNVNGGQTADTKTGAKGNDAAEAKLPSAATLAEVENAVKTGQQDRLIPLPDSISMKVLDTIPDLKHVYVAKLKHSVMRSDDFAIETTRDGLLKSVTLSSKEETPQVIVKLSEIAVQIGRIVAAYGGGLGASVKELTPAMSADMERYKRMAERRHYELILDLSDKETEGQLRVFSSNIRDIYETNYQFSFIKGSYLMDEGKDDLKKPEDQNLIINGVFYRRPQTYQFAIKKNGDGIYGEVFTLPNGGPVAGVPIKTGPFVTTTYNLAFDNGCLLKNAENHPSEVLGFISVIPEALKNIASIPGEMLQVKVDYSNKNEKLLQSQQNQIDLQNKIIDLQKKQEALLQQNQATTNPSAQSGK